MRALCPDEALAGRAPLAYRPEEQALRDMWIVASLSGRWEEGAI